MTGVAMAAALKHIEKTGEIHDWPELDLGKNAFDRVPFGEIELVEGKFAKFVQDGQASLLQRRIVIIVDAVHTDHRAAAFKKTAGESEANEACGAGNKDGILRHCSSAS